MSHFFRNNSGFTIVELLVSISIVTVILTVIILNQSTYTDSIALTNLADEISSTISQAQAYGIGVKGFSGEFKASYGVTFSIRTSTDDGDNKAYLNFVDNVLPLNQLYNGDWKCVHTECLGKVDITRGNFIEEICIVRKIPLSDQCNVAKRADISFARPSTEAQIKFFNNGGSEVGDPDDMGAKIRLQSPRGAIRSITVYKTGQISVQ
ncbi:MAG: prepilin-type N-terminal cleavage/methylation domain-containing protein [bacterium]|nr:prepilin-type N-terminal cleavage/methylation domain-containing protein [bacterium]